MSDYRIGLSIEHGDEFSYVVRNDTGQRYMVTAFDMRRKYPEPNQRDFHLHEGVWAAVPPARYDLYLGLMEESEPSAPKARRTWARTMGLRKPAGR